MDYICSGFKLWFLKSWIFLKQIWNCFYDIVKKRQFFPIPLQANPFWTYSKLRSLLILSLNFSILIEEELHFEGEVSSLKKWEFRIHEFHTWRLLEISRLLLYLKFDHWGIINDNGCSNTHFLKESSHFSYSGACTPLCSFEMEHSNVSIDEKFSKLLSRFCHELAIALNSGSKITIKYRSLNPCN